MALVEFALLAALCAPDVHVKTLSALVTHESRGAVYAIGLNDRDIRLIRQPQTLAEAVETAEWLRSEGYDFDAGLGQINVRNLDWLGLSVPDLFNPCRNLRGAAQVLRSCYDRAAKRFGPGQPALQAALSCYNTGDFQRGFTNGYVQKVSARVHLPVPALETGSDAAPSAGGPRPVLRKPAPMRSPGPDDDTSDAFATGTGDAFEQSR